MQSSKIQVSGQNSKFLILICTFALCLLPYKFASAECTPTLPKVVAHTGEFTGGLDTLVTKDGQGITIVDGSITVDLGCFSDHAGADLRLYVIGRSHGAEVSVGAKLGEWQLVPESMPPHYKPYVCTRSECGGYKPTEEAQYCDGKETLPEATDGCVTGDQWMNLDVPVSFSSLQQNYRYLRIVSDKGAHIDAVEVIAPSQLVDLYIMDGAERAQFLDGVSAGVYNFGAGLTGFAPGPYKYTFSCDEGHTVPVSGSVTVQADGTATIQVGALACSYGQDGGYQAHIDITGSSQASDSAGVVVGPKSATNGGSASRGASRTYLIVIAALIGLAIIFELVHRARLKNTSSSKL